VAGDEFQLSVKSWANLILKRGLISMPERKKAVLFSLGNFNRGVMGGAVIKGPRTGLRAN